MNSSLNPTFKASPIVSNPLQFKNLILIMNRWLDKVLEKHKAPLGGVPQLSSLREDQLSELKKALYVVLIQNDLLNPSDEGIVSNFFMSRINVEMSLFPQQIQPGPTSEKITNDVIAEKTSGSDPKPFDLSKTQLAGTTNFEEEVEPKANVITTSINSSRLELKEPTKLPRVKKVISKDNNKVVSNIKKGPRIFTKLKNLPQIMVRHFTNTLTSNNDIYRPYKAIISDTIEKKFGQAKAKEIENALTKEFNKINEYLEPQFKQLANSWSKLKKRLERFSLEHDLSLPFAACIYNFLNCPNYFADISTSPKLSPNIKELLQKEETKKNITRWIKKKFAN